MIELGHEEREQAEREAHYKSLFEYHPDAVFSFDPNGRFTSVNKSAVSLSGYDSKELLDMTFDVLLTPEYRESSRWRFEKALAGEPQYYESCIVRKNGRKTFIDVTNVPIVVHGKVIGVYGIARDMSEDKLAEEKLREAEKKYRGIIENILDVYYRTDMDGRLVMISPSGISLFGYGLEAELIGKDLADILYLDPGEKQVLLSALEDIGFVKDYEVTLRHKDGAPIPVSTSSRYHYDESGNILGVEGIFRDIRKRRRIEKALLESTEKYRELFELESDAIFMVDNATGNILEANIAASTLYGFTHQELLKLKHTDLSVEPSETRRVTLDEEVLVPARWHRKKDGTVFPVEITARHFVWEGAQVHIAAIRDISERRRIEEERQQSFTKLRKALGGTIKAISSAVEMRDPYTAGHQRRVADLARYIATEMNLKKDQIEGIRMASTIHDIGKIAVPAEILSKPTKLTEHEYNLIKFHPQSGYDILKDIEFPWPIARIILEHHERIDGSGYPNGLNGENLLVESKILAVADVVDAMASHRPYRPALGLGAALGNIEKGKRSLFDGDVVDACFRVYEKRSRTQ
jgi:PAS domain S-box-containing protein